MALETVRLRPLQLGVEPPERAVVADSALSQRDIALGIGLSTTILAQEFIDNAIGVEDEDVNHGQWLNPSASQLVAVAQAPRLQESQARLDVERRPSLGVEILGGASELGDDAGKRLLELRELLQVFGVHLHEGPAVVLELPDAPPSEEAFHEAGRVHLRAVAAFAGLGGVHREPAPADTRQGVRPRGPGDVRLPPGPQHETAQAVGAGAKGRRPLATLRAAGA
mmetsp:Transcript_103226/g.296260  ORF Transcript_103226/g.296260 Transcript_103226/m.296260 type:complete len:224 (+) Transcript_103226:1309-1980(+)